MTAEAPRILLVDSDPEILHVLPALMGRVGDVVTAKSSPEALAVLGSQGADLLVIANRLLADGGPELLQALRQRRPFAQVMILCEQHTTEIPASILAERIGDTLVKPFDVAGLPSRLNALLELMRQQQRRARLQHDIDARMQHHDRVALLGTLVATVAHDIANPLSVVSSNSALVSELIDSEAPFTQDDLTFLRDATKDTLDAATAIRNYCARILDFSQPDGGGKRGWDSDLEETVRLALLFVRARTQDLAVSLHIDPLGTLTPIFHHASAFSQALVNALTNAIDAAGPDGNVWLRVEETTDDVAVLVEDDGPGLTPEQKERLCEPFFTTKATGTGLGAAVIAQVMREHGGCVTWRNLVDGRGVSVRLTLPKKASSGPPPERYVAR